ncbi:hypothetical protein CH373_02905 [Leptospira perolatii]|uniref:Uncharacterized protein n=1 Tax=Leptospira perolatii TaxID=2023191 RepID=A0A2M9ZTC1_9LEPT|nr:hypothetical protein [Leptospira perolatii]PJZ71604.1 hypothetical protein CH360_02900 [Leptospira perolatii]PJZ75219.1 hypothetical protein CH373_02905 [Leptospira perolatii]
MNSKSYYLLFLNFILINCSYLQWRPASLAIERGWSENGNHVVQTEVIYEERDAWNPLTGTTHKRNYGTKFRIYLINDKAKGDGSPPIFTKEVSSWTLPGSVYFHSASSLLFWIQGKNDEYAGKSRFPAIWSPELSIDQDLSSILLAGETVLQFVPAPDAELAALILGKVDPSLEILSPRLVFWNVKDRKTLTSISLNSWKEVPNYRIRWSVNSKTLYLRMEDKVSKAENDFHSLSKASEFPLCFFPPTNFGPVGISPAGSGGDTSFDRKIEPPLFKKFEKVPMISDVGRIRDCSNP